MLYAIKDEKIQTQAVEYSVAYHCNLKCSACSHMSPFISTKLPPLESFAKDVNALSTALHAKDIRLVGGEPLQHPEIVGFLKAARESGIADTIMVTTNGLLLHSRRVPQRDRDIEAGRRRHLQEPRRQLPLHRPTAGGRHLDAGEVTGRTGRKSETEAHRRVTASHQTAHERGESGLQSAPLRIPPVDQEPDAQLTARRAHAAPAAR